MNPKTIAKIFAVASGVLGLVYLVGTIYMLVLGFRMPTQNGISTFSMIGLSVIPATIGFYLLYCYILLSAGAPTRFSPTTIWIVTAVFNLAGIIWVPIWPIIAVTLSIVAIVKLKNDRTMPSSESTETLDR